MNNQICQHCIYKPGSRSFGDRLPGLAQGAYLPGDEPGSHCDLDDMPCYTEYHDTQHDLCAIQEDAGLACPDCGKMMLKNGAGVVYCPECGHIQNREE